MNQLVEKFSNSSLARSYCEDMRNFILSISSKYGVDARTATLYVILGCLCLWVYVSNRRRGSKTKPTSPDRTRSYCVGEIHGGALVLQRLEEDFKKAQVNPLTLAKTENLLKALLEEEHLDLMKLQHTVAKLEMSLREDSAVKILKQATKDNAEKKPQAYEIEMLLVEMLIYQGDLKYALKCECLEDKSIKDARRPLYKAIMHKMQGETERAKEYWDEFVEVRDPLYPPYRAVLPINNFEEFENKVDILQSAIKEFAGRVNK